MKAGPRNEPKPALVLRLYIAGGSPNAVLARRHLEAAVGHLPPDQLSLEIIDVLREPLRALRDGVLVTPMLVRSTPPSEQRLVGNLRNREAVLAVLGLDGVSNG